MAHKLIYAHAVDKTGQRNSLDLIKFIVFGKSKHITSYMIQAYLYQSHINQYFFKQRKHINKIKQNFKKLPVVAEMLKVAGLPDTTGLGDTTTPETFTG